MANDFYRHSGHPGTRAPRSSALLRAEFAAIEDGFDKLPDVGTANLFSVSNGSALVGKTAAQTKVILALENVTNTADADKPISTLAQAALNLKAPLASPALTGNPTAPTPSLLDNDTSIATTAFLRNLFGSLTNSTYGYQYFPPASGHGRAILLQWGFSNASSAEVGYPRVHSFGVAYDAVLAVVVSPHDATLGTVVNIYDQTTTGFTSVATKVSALFRYIAIGYVTLT